MRKKAKPEKKEKEVKKKEAKEELEAEEEVKEAEEIEEIEEILPEEMLEVEEEPEEKIEKEEIKRKEKEGKAWKVKTNLGKLVKEGKIKDIDEILDKGMRIMEEEIVDALLSLQTDFIAIGQSKGKFGGGKRRIWRQTQKKTAEANVPSFGCMAVVGDGKGHIGLGYGKARETLPAREKAIRKAKLNIIKIRRGCGSFDCACNEEHSIPFTVKGKSGSARITLMPAPKGTGLVIEDECKKILRLAGISDVYSRTFGETRTKFNLATACFKALKRTTEILK